jgi:hypothetical protein
MNKIDAAAAKKGKNTEGRGSIVQFSTRPAPIRKS